MRRGTLPLCARVVQSACVKLLTDLAGGTVTCAGLACDSGDSPTFCRSLHKMFKIASQRLTVEGSLRTTGCRARGAAPPAPAGVLGEVRTAGLDTMLRSPALSALRRMRDRPAWVCVPAWAILTVDDTPERPML